MEISLLNIIKENVGSLIIAGVKGIKKQIEKMKNSE